MTNILPSWNDTCVKKAIIDFVERVTDKNSSDFIQKSDRIAVFDNDGTLWTEQPMQIQGLFANDRLKFLAVKNPAMKETQPYKAFFEHDHKTLASFGKKELMEFVFTTHDGKTPEEFTSHVSEWFAAAEHPLLKTSYSNCIYKPQVELLEYLRANGFKTFIVSGGGVDFMRVIAEKYYGIPNEQVIGSSGKTKLEMENNKPVVTRLHELNSFDDREEKVLNIHLHIGKRPVFVFGNSDGDLKMMQYTLSGGGARMALLLHHDDAKRETAYDKDFKLSPLKEALEVVNDWGINIVSMQKDWKKVF